MATEVVMPQMGESIAEGTITKWLVKVGEQVTRDQPLFEISTDKVDAEIPSPSAGTLLEIKHQEGETVPVNEVVAVIGEAGAQATGAQPAAPQPAAATPAEPAQAAASAAPAGKAAPAPAGERPTPAAAPEPTPQQRQEVRTEAAREEAGGEEQEDEGGAGEGERAGAPAGEEGEGERLRKFSSPLVRSIAAKEGVDLGEVEGTGAHGRVTKNDILAYLDRRRAAPATPAAATAAAAPAQRPAGGFSVPAYVEGENVEIEPMSRIRQLTAAHMVYSKATSAHVTTVFHIDLSRVARLRARAKDGFAQKEGTKLTYMPFIFKAVINALKAHKKLNASLDGTSIVYKKDINLGIAVDLGYGLIVPVIKRADQLSLVGLAKTANDLAERARAKKLKPEEVQGGTFTITNPGVFGSLWGSPIINQPQVAILGIGAVEKRPIVTTDDNGNDALAIRTMCYFSITYDHRLVDGADADRFMIEVKRTLEQDTWTELDAYV